jgi:GNAT superfamily N-acetyltransferase
MLDLPAPTFPRPDASVRPARQSDAEALAAVTLASWREQYAAVLPAAASALDQAALVARWTDALDSSDGSTVYVACAGDDVVGLAVVAPGSDPDLVSHASGATAVTDEADVAEVAELVVRPGSTREGHGSRLLAAAVDHARGQGRTSVVVWCGTGDDARRAFLESAGLAPDGATRTLDDGAGTIWRQVRLAASITEE